MRFEKYVDHNKKNFLVVAPLMYRYDEDSFRQLVYFEAFKVLMVQSIFTVLS